MKNGITMTLRDVWDGIRSQPGRVGIACLAIALGMAVLTILISIMGGLKEKSARITNELGANVVAIIQNNDQNKNPANNLLEKHAAFLARNIPGSLVSSLRSYKVPTLGTDDMLSVVATDSSFLRIKQWKMFEGRFFDVNDINNRERHAVVSKPLSDRWAWETGDLVMLNDIPFKIIGIVSTGGATYETEVGDAGLIMGEHLLFVPNTIYPYWISESNNPMESVDAIYLKVPDSRDFEGVVSTAMSLMSQPGYRIEGISWVTSGSLLKGIKKLQKTIGGVVGSIAMLCLALGGILLMTLMIENIRGRVVEIGLRRALGASKMDIAALFTLEAILVTGTATLVGILVSHSMIIWFGDLFPVELQLGFGSFFLPFVAAIFLTILFSYWPARLAANITPAEALRND